jgi:hypothetical protein
MEAAPNKRSYVRLAAMRALLKGYERREVCDLYDRTDRLVRLWIELFNRGGIDALITKPRPGRRRKVKLERVRDLLVPVLESSNANSFWSNYGLWPLIPGSSCGFPTNVVLKTIRDRAGAGCSQENVGRCLIWVTISGRT